jgi:hypothetical protein
MHAKLYSKNLKGKDSLGDVSTDERIISEHILEKQDVIMQNGFIKLSGCKP